MPSFEEGRRADLTMWRYRKASARRGGQTISDLPGCALQGSV